ncbi:MAG: hypothetical protein ABIQ16_19840, partial [Polyangiaceae bacterium]
HVGPSKTGTAQTILTGALAASGKTALTVRVVDANGAFAERTFVLAPTSTPTISPPSLPSVCANEVYSVTLSATGGDPTTYKWTTDLPTSTGLAIQDKPLLSGTFKATAGSQSLKFTLRLADGDGCAAKPVALELQRESGTSICSTIVVQSAGAQLPAACEGFPYAQQLATEGAAGPYDWKAVDPLPPGLGLDSNGKLSGTVGIFGPDAGKLIVQASNVANGRRFEGTFDLQQRDKCWFAYLSTVAHRQQLNLFDPVLGNRKSLPSAADETVSDFEFAPSGEYVAYRVGPPSAAAKLVVVRMRDWGIERFAFSAVSSYAWSPDSQFLAVAHTATDAALSLVQMTAVTSDAISTPPNLSFPVLGPKKAAVSAMAWIGAGHVAYFTPPDPLTPLQWELRLSNADASGILDPKQYGEPFLAGDLLRPAAYGVFTVSRFLGIIFYANDGSEPVGHADDVVVAASGRYVARAEDSQLKMFRAFESSSYGETEHVAKPGCDAILAWASGKERLACSWRDASQKAQLRFFDMDPTTDLLSGVSDVGPALSGDAAEHARLFTGDGKRFAFTTDDSLQVVAIDASAPTLFYSASLTAASTKGPFPELAFSPDGQLILQHRGAQLSVFDLQNPVQHEVPIAQGLAASGACSETFYDWTSSFCGEERNPSMLWAPAADLAVFQLANGTLQIGDFTRFDQGAAHTVAVDDACGTDCIVTNQWAFQP